MTAIHTYLVRFKFGILVLVLSVSGFVVSFLVGIAMEISHVEVKTDCKAPFNYYEIRRDGTKMIIKGIYSNYPTGKDRGILSFSGAVSYSDADGKMERDVIVSRVVDYRLRFRDGRFLIETLSAGNQLGDNISDDYVQKYIFPGSDVGQQTNTSIFLINGRTLALGPTKTPRVLCY